MIENTVYNQDCMIGMAQYPDKHFDLAIVDPPYFTGPNKRKHYGRSVNKLNIRRIDYPVTDNWEIPNEAYFNELFRISKHQIIWGCNYYDFIFPSSGRIIWNKCNTNSSFSDCEIAYCSLHDSVRMFSFMWNGMLQGKSIQEGHLMQGNKALNEKRIHPTQKPVMLYKWLMNKYAKPNDKILSTHVGSGSDRIAAFELGFYFTGFEIEKIHFYNQENRFKKHIQPQLLFRNEP